MGIDALEVAAINVKDDFFNRYPYLDVKTDNESIYDKEHNIFAKRIGQVLAQCTRVAESVRHVLVSGSTPIVFSGDHSSALGTISGIKSAYPDDQIGVVWIDAHADIHSPNSSPSGNIHGMPLSAAMAIDNHQYKINDVDQNTIDLWNNMKVIGTGETKILPQHLIYFGVRDTEEAEDRIISELNIRNFRVEEVHYKGIRSCVSEALSRMEACKYIYISFDVDSMDADRISDGTGTPVAKGFDPEEIASMISLLCSSGKVVCIEVCEINPLLDTKNKMAETAFSIIRQVVPDLVGI